jgi:hypothetical protein
MLFLFTDSGIDCGTHATDLQEKYSTIFLRREAENLEGMKYMGFPYVL